MTFPGSGILSLLQTRSRALFFSCDLSLVCALSKHISSAQLQDEHKFMGFFFRRISSRCSKLASWSTSKSINPGQAIWECRGNEPGNQSVETPPISSSCLRGRAGGTGGGATAQMLPVSSDSPHIQPYKYEPKTYSFSETLCEQEKKKKKDNSQKGQQRERKHWQVTFGHSFILFQSFSM